MLATTLVAASIVSNLCVDAKAFADVMRKNSETPAYIGKSMVDKSEAIMVLWVSSKDGSYTISRTDSKTGLTCLVDAGSSFRSTNKTNL